MLDGAARLKPLFAETDLDHVESASPGVPVAAWAG